MDRGTNYFCGAYKLCVDNVAKLLLRSQLVEAWLLDEIYEDAHYCRSFVSLLLRLEVGEAARIRIWLVVTIDLVKVVLIAVFNLAFIEVVDRFIGELGQLLVEEQLVSINGPMLEAV